MLAGRCILCGRPVDDTCAHLPHDQYAHDACLWGKDKTANARQEVLAALAELQYGVLTVKVHQGLPADIETTHKRKLG